MVYPLYKTVSWFLKNLNTELPYDQEISLLSICQKGLKTQTYICTYVFTAALFTRTKRLKVTQITINE